MNFRKRTYQHVNSAGYYSSQEVMDFATCIIWQEKALLPVCALLAPLYIHSHTANEAMCWFSIQWTLSNYAFLSTRNGELKQMKTIKWWVRDLKIVGGLLLCHQDIQTLHHLCKLYIVVSFLRVCDSAWIAAKGPSFTFAHPSAGVIYHICEKKR
jgi:hypothetical protein